MADAAVQWLLDASANFVTRHVSYVFQARVNVNDLHQQFENLVELIEMADEEIETLSFQGGESKSFRTYYDNLKKVKCKAEQFFLREDGSNYNCFNVCPNPWVRWQLGREATCITDEITKLRNQKEEYWNIRSHHQVLEVPEARNDYNPPSRTKLCEEIFNSLKYPDNQVIGCYGKPGLGKTTLAREVFQLARETRPTINKADASKRTPLGSGIKDEKFFDTVIMIEVNKSPVITKIQELIAKGLRLSLNGEMDPASFLYNALKKKKTKVLIIFDDIWNVLDMKSVGVPCGKGLLTPKILLISRDLSVLRKTGSTVDFQLKELLYLEAEKLFLSLVGKVEDETLVSQILDKCDGHPYIIFIVASMVKKKDLSIWNYALSQFDDIDNPDFVKTIYNFYQNSIDSAEDEELKYLMLLCGILGEHKIPVLNLLMYCVGLGWYSMGSLETACQRLHKLIIDLQDRSLLDEFDETLQYVNIPAVAMKSAARLAVKTKNFFTPHNDKKLDRLPSILKNFTRISLPYAVNELPDKLESPDLEFFLYHSRIEEVGDNDVPRCSDSIFAECIKLNVLSFKGISTRIPSLVNLINLRTLCLHECCFKDSGFPDVKGLKKLEVLSLRESDLTCLPMEVKMLTRLKLLDLHGCKDLKGIPTGLLSGLLKLEHLYMRETGKFRWNLEGNASLSELKSMKLLTCIEIDIEPGVEIPGNMDCNKLQKFYITQGIKCDDADDCYGCKLLLQSLPQSRSATLLQRADFIHLQGVICQQKELFGCEGFKYLTKLHIDDCNGMQYLFSLSMAKNLVKLKSLIIEKSDTIEEIVYIEADDRRNKNLSVIFPKLVDLSLSNLSRLRYFVNTSSDSGQLPFFGREVFLPELNSLRLDELPKLETVWGEVHDSLSKLQQIEIYDCNALVTLLSSHVLLSELERLWLINLPKLVSTWAEKLHPGSLRKLSSIYIVGCSELVTVFSSSVLLSELEKLWLVNIPKLESTWAENLLPGSLRKLSSIYIAGCSELVTIFSSSSVSPLELKELALLKLPKLETVWSDNLQADPLSKLKNLYIEDCSSFVALINSHVSPNKLEDISIEDCRSLVTVINSHVSLPELKDLGLVNLPQLETVWSKNLQAESSSKLESIYIEDCSSLVTLFNSDVSLPELNYLGLVLLPKLETVWKENMQANFLSKLQYIYITECSSLVTLFNTYVSIPELQNLVLVKLSKFEYLWRGNVQAESLVTLMNSNVSFYKLKWVRLEELPKLESIWGVNLMEDSLCKMEHISIKNCSALVTLISSPVSLPQLDELIMKNLPKLETVCDKKLVDGSLSNLKKLEIEDCYNVRTPFTYMDFESHLESCQLKNLPNLDGLWVEKLINLCGRTLKAGSISGCGTFSSHILNILDQLKPITDSEGEEEEVKDEEKEEEKEIEEK